jgi:DNA polymerase-3 subunit chi
VRAATRARIDSPAGVESSLTEIDFYTHADDRLQVAARLCMKLYGLGKQVRVLTVDPAMTARLDQMLWMTPATGFLPHCRLSDRLAPDTPVIVDHADEHQGVADVLINLQPVAPPFFRRFERLAEIVDEDPDTVAAGRTKWQAYKQQGYTLRVHDLRTT